MAPLNRLWLAGFMTGITTNHKRCTYNKNTTWKLNIFFKRDWNNNHRNSSKKKYILNLKCFSFVSEMYKEKLHSQLILKSNIQSYNFFSKIYDTRARYFFQKSILKTFWFFDVQTERPFQASFNILCKRLYMKILHSKCA